jgi:hypothetical protein
VETISEWVDRVLAYPEEAPSAFDDPKFDGWLRDIQEREDVAQLLTHWRGQKGSFWERVRPFLEGSGILSPAQSDRMEDVLAETERLLQAADGYLSARKHQVAKGLYLAVNTRDPGNGKAVEGLRVADANQKEEENWEKAKQFGKPWAFEQYLAAYSTGFYATEAKALVEAGRFLVEAENRLEGREFATAREHVQKAREIVGDTAEVQTLLNRIEEVEAPALLAKKLRAELLKDMRNVGLRKRYLVVRTPDLMRKDELYAWRGALGALIGVWTEGGLWLAIPAAVFAGVAEVVNGGYFGNLLGIPNSALFGVLVGLLVMLGLGACFAVLEMLEILGGEGYLCHIARQFGPLPWSAYHMTEKQIQQN